MGSSTKHKEVRTLPQTSAGTEDEETDEHGDGEVAMASYPSSPTQTMSEKEMISEQVIGYLIVLITLGFVIFLILGYLQTTNVPYCTCSNTTDTYNSTECEGVTLTYDEDIECEHLNNASLVDYEVEKTFYGDCNFTLQHFLYGFTNLQFLCNPSPEKNDTVSSP